MYPISFEDVKRLYESGMTQSEVGAALGTTQTVILKTFRRNQYKPRIEIKRDIGRKKSWKGSNSCYVALHKRLYALYGKPQKCEICGTTDPSKGYDWANLTGNYEDPADYKRMCRSCHSKYDGKIKSIKHMQEYIYDSQ
jgi:DNA-binding XRE family transcriptional regulator